MMVAGLFKARSLLALWLLFAVASADVSRRQWVWRSYDTNRRSSKPGRPVDITVDLGVDPALPGCFGAKYRERRSRGRFGPLQNCVGGNKANNMFIAPDGAIRVRYPQGEWGSKGGAQFYRNFSSDLGMSAILSYELKFGDRFNPTKGGKLPGLYGGNKACSGGNKAASKACFSLRVMWRRHWGGASYMYIPTKTQSEEFCRNCYVSDTAFPTCDQVVRTSESGGLELAPGAAVSRDMIETKRAYCDFGRRFKLNAIPHNETYRFFFPHQEDNHRWPHPRYIKLTQVVHLNTIDKKSGWPNADGYYGLYMDGRLVHHANNMVYRNTEALQISGLFFSTFMGGNDPSWAPKRDMHADFRNFAIVRNNVFEIPRVSPEVLHINTASERRRSHVIRLARPIPSDVDGIVFSSEVTCLAAKYFVRVERLPGDRLGVQFPRSGKYTLCLRSRFTSGNVYIPQRDAVVMVYENGAVTDTEPRTIFFEGDSRTTDVVLKGHAKVGDYVAFSRAGDCFDDLQEVTRVTQRGDTKIIKDIHLSQPGLYKLCYSHSGSNYRVQPAHIQIQIMDYCKDWACSCTELYSLRSHRSLTKAQKDFLNDHC